MEEKCISIQVKGRVQGVAFRYHTKKTAEKYNIEGFVRNMPDGSVYMEACGTESNLALFQQWCRQGPTMARVTEMQVNPLPPTQVKGFSIRF